MGINHDRYEGLGPINVFIKDAGVMPYGIAQLPIAIKQPDGICMNNCILWHCWLHWFSEK
jgi:hypothetical protein